MRLKIRFEGLLGTPKKNEFTHEDLLMVIKFLRDFFFFYTESQASRTAIILATLWSVDNLLVTYMKARAHSPLSYQIPGHDNHDTEASFSFTQDFQTSAPQNF